MSSRSSGSEPVRTGQIPQMFIFLMAVLVIGATIFLGIRLIGGLQNTACEANEVGFVKDVQNVMDENSVFGSRGDAEIQATCDALELCFVDARVLEDKAISSSFTNSSYPVIQSAVRQEVKTNVYLKGRDKTVPEGYDARIILSDRNTPPDPATAPLLVCIPAVGGRFRFNAEGYGRYVRITP